MTVFPPLVLASASPRRRECLDMLGLTYTVHPAHMEEHGRPGESAVEQERAWLQPKAWVGPAVLTAVLLIVMIVTLASGDYEGSISGETLTAKMVGISLFGPYLVIVELAAMLLLAALVAASHLGRSEAHDEADLARERQRELNEQAQADAAPVRETPVNTREQNRTQEGKA